MSLYPISISETNYIAKGVEADFRVDGRDNLSFRDFSIVTGVVSQTYGSARCRLGSLGKGTDVLVGIKAEIGNWTPGEPDNLFGKRGKIVCNVQISPISSQFFSGRSSDDLEIELTQILANSISLEQSSIDLEQLCIIEKQAYWILYVDALVLGYDGNIIDTLFYATRAAFSDIQLPKVVVESVLDEETNTEHQAFEIIDDPSALRPFNDWENIPMSVTSYIIGKRYVVDCSVQEETISTARITVTINKNGDICSIHKGDMKTGISPSLLQNILSISKRIGVDLVSAQSAKIENAKLSKDDSEIPDTSLTFLNLF
ncbi:hypothetical protein BB560_000838 [Smittium megazygosporum]|uniref:Ribosomal RNA-processing protein 42 n=1 Tax=Smittium megazygosporum TaxID=133381 RepID=A0A2T9ZJ74_9FUNG|nr:hypothetical protein BB560_000838 [Smittium megazygosporum]